MSKKKTSTTEATEFQLLEEEIGQERTGFDLFERLTQAPKRKPEVVNIYLDEETGSELGYVREIRNELGVVIGHERKGVHGEIDEELSKPEAARDEKKLAALKKRRKALQAKIEKSALEFTLQWIPPLIEETLAVKAMRAIGVKQKPVPDAKLEEFSRAWRARALEACLVQIRDVATGEVKDKITVAEAEILRQNVAKEQFAKIDVAINRLINREAISQEALDSADF